MALQFYCDILESLMKFCVDRRRGRIRVPCVQFITRGSKVARIPAEQLCQKSSTLRRTLIKAPVCPRKLSLMPENLCFEVLEHGKQSEIITQSGAGVKQRCRCHVGIIL